MVSLLRLLRVLPLHALLVAALVGPGVATAWALQPGGDVLAPFIRPVEAVSPVGELANWFVLELDAENQASAVGQIQNLADVPQAVDVEFRDLEFGEDGTPTVSEGLDGFAAWTQVDGEASFTMAPGERRDVSFTVDLPADTEPGDHIGVVLVISRVRDGDREITRRVGRRIYATVPGDAARALTIEHVSVPLDNIWFPTSSDVAALVRNDGRIRLSPTVTIRDIEADGPPLVVSRSAELFTATIDVPWYGGPVKVPVKATAEGGIERTATVTRWVIPWGLLLVLVLLAGLVQAVRRYRRERHGKYAKLQAELRRLEGLVTGDKGRDAEEVDETVEQMRAMRSAFKNARRSGNTAAMPKLAMAMHALGSDALEDLLEAYGEADNAKAREDVAEAVATYDVRRITASSKFIQLDPERRDEILAAMGDESADG